MNALTKQEGGALALPELESLLRFDAGAGRFYWRVDRRGGAKAGDKAGTSKPGGYVAIHFCGRLLYAHRIAWLFVHKVWPEGVIDHRDGDPANNRPSNLRDVSQGRNLENQRRAHRSNKSCGLLGASFDTRTGRWLAKISVNNRTLNLGRHDTAEAAHAAYLVAKRDLHEGAML